MTRASQLELEQMVAMQLVWSERQIEERLKHLGMRQCFELVRPRMGEGQEGLQEGPDL